MDVLTDLIFTGDLIENLRKLKYKLLHTSSWSNSLFIIVTADPFLEGGGIDFGMMIKVQFLQKNNIEIFQQMEAARNNKTIPVNEETGMADIKNSNGHSLLHPAIAEIKISDVIHQLHEEYKKKKLQFHVINFVKNGRIASIPTKSARCDKIEELEIDNDIDFIKHKFCSIKSLIDRNLAYDGYTVSFMTQPKFTFYTFLLNFVDEPLYQRVFLVIVYQVMHTIQCIRDRYPTFMHGDLHCNNVAVSTFKDVKKPTRYLNRSGELYGLENIGIIARIIDFGFSEIPELKIYNQACINPFLDMHHFNDASTFLHSIYVLNKNNANSSYINNALAAIDKTHLYKFHTIEHIQKYGQKSIYEYLECFYLIPNLLYKVESITK